MKNLKKNLIIFGTRPEAIKMAPLVKEFSKHVNFFETKICVTGQHREMLSQVLDFFEIKPDFDLCLMKPNQNLYTLTSDVITGLKSVLEEYNPDYVYVHGDTTTAMASSIAAFYSGAKICHIEAGLRTFNKRSPFPEEINRGLIGRICDYHFTPTEVSKKNLMDENILEQNILITGNTVIDALHFSKEKVLSGIYLNDEISELKKSVNEFKNLILVTGHRRENHGQGLVDVCLALKEIAETNSDVQIIYPVHLNPNVQKLVYELLGGVKNIQLIAPLSYPAFIWLMTKSYLIITDSGGIQEEAPSLGKPVLVIRDRTERPEVLESGTALLVGTDKVKIVHETQKLLDDKNLYLLKSKIHNPYGDGFACSRIVNYIKDLN